MLSITAWTLLWGAWYLSYGWYDDGASKIKEQSSFLD